ncbi:hypothetical protein C0J52_03247 [Blattella germanica]|nr:hypothetical protein C0J52_03247 [Blattella germanica]
MSFLNSVDLGGNQFDCSDCNSLEFGSLLRNIEENGTLEIHSLNLENELFCGRKGSSNPIPIKNVTSLPADCTPSDDWVTLGSVLGTILLLIVVVIGVFSFYKFEVAYLIFLLRQKRKANSTGETNDYEFDAFVCYSRSDRAWVIQEMVPTLEEAEEKFRLCLHERDFILGSFITLNVILSMQKSRYTILVLSNSFIQSQWCRWEMEMANHKLFESGREFLILLELQRLDPDTLPRHLKFLMDTRTYLEWPEPNSDSSTAWKRLKKNLGKSIHQQQLEKHQQAISLH